MRHVHFNAYKNSLAIDFLLYKYIHINESIVLPIAFIHIITERKEYLYFRLLHILPYYQ